MANPHFSPMFADNDATLIDTLNEQAIYDRGVGVRYITKDKVLVDAVMNETVVSMFDEAFDVDILIEPNQSFFIPNMGMDFSGLNMNSEFTKVSTHRKSFDSIVGRNPKEGDLIYVDSLERFFEVQNVDHKDPLSSGGRYYTYDFFLTPYSFSAGNHHFDTDALDIVNTEVLDDFLHQVNPEDYDDCRISADSTLVTADNVAAFIEDKWNRFTADNDYGGVNISITADSTTLFADNTSGYTADYTATENNETEDVETKKFSARNDQAGNEDIDCDPTEIKTTVTTNPFDIF